MQKTTKIQRHGKEYWHEQIIRWRESGMTQIEYCRANGINKWSFWSWRKRLSQDGEANHFIEIKAQADLRGKTRTIEIALNGAIIRVNEDINPHVLSGILFELGWQNVR
jgi:hypothetical protein